MMSHDPEHETVRFVRDVAAAENIARRIRLHSEAISQYLDHFDPGKIDEHARDMVAAATEVAEELPTTAHALVSTLWAAADSAIRVVDDS